MRLAGLVLLAFLAMAAPAAAKTESASLGDVRGELSYTKKGDRYVGFTERVFIGDELVIGRRIDDDEYLMPGGGIGGESVKVVDLDGDGTGEVIFDLYTGGAHCCLFSDIFKGPDRQTYDWGNIGYVLKDFEGDGVPEFRTADDRFSALYSSFAASQQPLLVYRYDADGPVDFTRDPSVVKALKAESRRFLRRYDRFRKRRGPAGREVVAAALAGYAADRCNLGACSQGYALIKKALARGDLPAKSNFLKVVRSDLQQFGYDRF